MATAKANRSIRSGPPPGHPRRRLWLRALLLVLVLAAVLLAFYWSTLMAYARTGASYGARTACSCHYEGGRDLADCKKDFEPGMGLISLGADAGTKSVTARFPLLARQTATYREGWGCVLEPWQD